MSVNSGNNAAFIVKRTVMIPRPGNDDCPLEVHLKIPDIGTLQIFSAADYDDYQIFSAIVSGWDADEDFTQENIRTFIDYYPGGWLAVLEAWKAEVVRHFGAYIWQIPSQQFH